MRDYIHDILSTLQQQKGPVTVTELQRATEDLYGAKSATFYRNWRELKDSKNIERDDQGRVSFTGIMPEPIERERKIKPTSKVYEIVRKMPPLYHKLPDEEFSFKKSQALAWLIQQDEVLQTVWGKYSHQLEFNHITRKWTGKNYK